MQIRQDRVDARIRRASGAVIERLEARQLLSATLNSTPFHGAPIAANQTIEAEDYDLGGEGVAYHDTTPKNLGGANYRPGDAVDVQAGGSNGYDVGYAQASEWLNYTLSVPQAGMYTLQAGVANIAAGGSFHASFSGVDLSGEIAVPSTGGWQSYRTVASSTFTLAAGQQVMRVTLDQNAASYAVGNFDWFKLVPVAKPTMGSFHGTPFTIGQTIEAEDYDLGGEGVAYHDTTPKNLGGANYRPGDAVDVQAGGSNGYDVGYAQASEWLNYTLSVPQAGMYTLQAGVANIAAGGSFHASFSGVDLSGEIAVPSTGGWQSYRTVASSTFTLAAGQQVMRVTLDQNAASYAVGNFDWFKLVPVAKPTMGSFHGTPFTIGQTIEAEDYDLGGEGVAYHDTTPKNLGGANYRPGDAVDVQAGGSNGYDVGYAQASEWLNYTLSVPQAGMYTLQAGVANIAAGGSFHASFSGVDLSGEIAVPSTGGWQSYRTVASSTFTLAAGQQVMRVTLDQNAASYAVGNFDWFKLVPVAKPTMGSFHGTPFTIGQTIEAEDYDLGGEGVAYHDTTPKNLGGANYRPGDAVDVQAGGSNGYDVGYAEASEWLTYTIDVPQAGTYTLQASVADIAAGGLFHANFSGINLTGAISIPNTGGWQTYRTVASASFTLPAGQMVMRIALDQNAASYAVGNFDYFKITAPAVPPPPVIPPP